MDSEHEKNGNYDNVENKCKDLNKAAPEVVVLDTDEGSERGGASSPPLSCFFSRANVYRPIAPFLLKIYDMLENDETNSLIRWTSNGTSFVVTNPHSFADNVLPIYFRHNNFQSFIAQLNSYGFRKISWEHWEYSNDHFRKGERHLLKNINRRNQISRAKTHQSPSANTLYLGAPSCSRSNAERQLDLLTNEHDQLRRELAEMKEKQAALERKLASLKRQAATNSDVVGRDAKGIMLMAGGILGKRKFEEKLVTRDDKKAISTTMRCDSGGGGGSSSANVAQMNTLVSLEDVFGESSEWAEYYKNLMEKAS